MLFGTLSLSGGFMKLNVVFPPLIACAAALMRWYLASPVSEALVNAMPVPLAHKPLVVAACMPVLIFVSGLMPIMGLAAMAPTGYDNQHPRKFKDATSIAETYPMMFRLQSAHMNTIECTVMLMPAFWVAQTVGLEPDLFAKLAALLLAVRVLYVLAYALNADALRTVLFVIGQFCILSCGFAPLFPATVLPLLGVAAN